MQREEKETPRKVCTVWLKNLEKQAQSYTNSNVEQVCNSGTTLWNSGKEGKEKRTTEHQ
jgi:hypothetical protein